ncbi:hypothetical protein LTSEJOH_4331 [Salmonella enterica subsp. enterica serovar Johannesburg str. S5-703]|nr:hypothetical protein LTSEJOH_4331 [Salmonella enterica subsp. enterica serovar Johannesburg str. S5-703]
MNMPGGERALPGLHCLCKPGSVAPPRHRALTVTARSATGH